MDETQEPTTQRQRSREERLGIVSEPRSPYRPEKRDRLEYEREIAQRPVHAPTVWDYDPYRRND